MAASDPGKAPPPNGRGGDDIIELTEVVAEAPAEVVLDMRPGVGLDALKPLAPAPEEQPPTPLPGEADEGSLDDLLSSLPDLPDDLDIPAEAPPLEFRGKTPDLRQELAQRLTDPELRELVREVVQETVERLAREMLPDLAGEALDRELARWRKRLLEQD